MVDKFDYGFYNRGVELPYSTTGRASVITLKQRIGREAVRVLDDAMTEHELRVVGANLDALREFIQYVDYCWANGVAMPNGVRKRLKAMGREDLIICEEELLDE